MDTTPRPKTKAAKDVGKGAWCAFGHLAWQVIDTEVSDRDTILIEWGNGSVSEFAPDEPIRMHYDD